MLVHAPCGLHQRATEVATYHMAYEPNTDSQYDAAPYEGWTSTQRARLILTCIPIVIHLMVSPYPPLSRRYLTREDMCMFRKDRPTWKPQGVVPGWGHQALRANRSFFNGSKHLT